MDILYGARVEEKKTSPKHRGFALQVFRGAWKISMPLYHSLLIVLRKDSAD
jgi:hypothetical protein